ncbi:GNAT family N-acetyltransferase [Hymenobacter sp. H14-R3]|uniref:GNAT family N-acetyltransferase n=1 Tax=Hymenobacter sp. H14-R3 TaxID=3046308 RepID=UPI0024BAA535|nr:GNAT family N-acetyltransferase [Hymenobacter sp. H14-R3]MDJ0365577.1 GNAT family N-acetyltransferase [Hymenobacter sp. H14-R3]
MENKLTYRIGPATPADVPTLADVINRAYRSEAAHAGWTTEGHLLEGPRIDEATLHELLTAPHATLLKAETAAGYLAGCVYVEQQNKSLYFSMLAVAPQAQAHGLGRQLLGAVEAYAQRERCNHIKMSVLAGRAELLAWYERRGYQRTGVSEPFPDTTRFGRPRQLLTLLTLEKALSSK